MTQVPGWLDPTRARGPYGPVPSGLRPPAERWAAPAAVLLLFGEGPLGPDVLLIQRSSRGRTHAGQPAFPGGGVDPEDGGPSGRRCARPRRRPVSIRAACRCSARMPELYIWRSDNRVTPVLGWWHTPSAVHAASPAEVESVERVPIAELVDPGNRFTLRHPGGYAGPAFRVRGLLVWGFTAGLLDGVLREGGLERPWDPGAGRRNAARRPGPGLGAEHHRAGLETTGPRRSMVARGQGDAERGPVGHVGVAVGRQRPQRVQPGPVRRVAQHVLGSA